MKRGDAPQNGDFCRPAANLCALLLALSPSLLAYTPALMTEGAVGSFLLLGARAALALHGPLTTRPRVGWLSLLTVSLVAATYLRPQSILLAPVLGFLSCDKGVFKRALLGLGLLVVTLLCVAPWTARNCARMDSCVFVSANGGWNLLIGTFPEGQGAWIGLDGDRVPVECREVFEEVAKDRCFGEAGQKKILEDLGTWARLIPAKLRATFDHSAASTAHLLEAGALSQPSADRLRVIEYLSQRAIFLLVLFGSWALSIGEPPKMRIDKRSLGAVLLGLGALGFAGVSAVLGWLCVLGLQSIGWRRLSSPAAGLFAFNLLATMLVHAVFFGAGRYFYPVLLGAFPLCAPGIVYICRAFPRTAESLETST